MSFKNDFELFQRVRAPLAVFGLPLPLAIINEMAYQIVREG
jgi:hypothetical protein